MTAPVAAGAASLQDLEISSTSTSLTVDQAPNGSKISVLSGLYKTSHKLTLASPSGFQTGHSPAQQLEAGRKPGHSPRLTFGSRPRDAGQDRVLPLCKVRAEPVAEGK
jgi:hypothetical protein